MRKCCFVSARRALQTEALAWQRSTVPRRRQFSSTVSRLDEHSDSPDKDDYKSHFPPRNPAAVVNEPRAGSSARPRALDLSQVQGSTAGSTEGDVSKEQAPQPSESQERGQQTLISYDNPRRELPPSTSTPSSQPRAGSEFQPSMLRRVEKSFENPASNGNTPTSSTPAPGPRLTLKGEFRSRQGANRPFRPPTSDAFLRTSFRSPQHQQRPQHGPGRPKPSSPSDGDSDDPSPQDVDTWPLEHPKPEPQFTVYNPTSPTLASLTPDWPDTALDSRALVASTQQRLERLARRIPHGFVTTHMLAERYHAGELVRFESTGEREEVLKLAGELAQQRARKLGERKGTEVPEEDMGFADVVDEKDEFASRMVKGDYGKEKELSVDPAQEKLNVMRSLVGSLANNSTYQTPEMQKFVDKVAELLPATRARQGAPRAAAV